MRAGRGSGKKNSSLPTATIKNGSESRYLDLDDTWLLDPKTLSLVKTQVEDSGLVRMRRAQFVRTAITIFCKKGYHNTTVKEIASEAGVSAGLIYQYVSDKEDILFLALQLITQTLKHGLPEAIAQANSPIEKFTAAFKVYCRVIDANRDACMLTYRETKSLSREHRGAIKGMELDTNELISGCVRECIASGRFRELNVPLFVYNIIMIAHTWALKYWRLSQITTLDEYIDTNLELILSAVSATGADREAPTGNGMKRSRDKEKRRRVLAIS